VARILVIDDDPGVRGILTAFLETRDHIVVNATNGQDGLDRLSGEPFDMAFLDLQMPGMSGLELLTIIKERLPDLPVVVISGWADENLAKEALQSGAYEFLAKPFDLQDIELRLLEKLEMACSTDT